MTSQAKPGVEGRRFYTKPSPKPNNKDKLAVIHRTRINQDDEDGKRGVDGAEILRLFDTVAFEGLHKFSTLFSLFKLSWLY